MHFGLLTLTLLFSFVTSAPTNSINSDLAEIKSGIISIEKSIAELLSQSTKSPSTTQDPPPSTTQDPQVQVPQGEIASRYPNGDSCDTGGTHSVNEFGANICEYPGGTCPINKYFKYSDGETGVELCCKSTSDCNYNPIKNYCLPNENRCVDGSYFGCSLKAGPIFDSCK